MLVTVAEARPLRSLGQARIELGPGIVSLVGPNGVGKTNFLEGLYFALTGRSFRTADRRDLIPFGGSFARAEATVRDEDGVERHLLASVSRSDGRRHLLDGSPADPATLARSRPPVAVFSPDRLALIKGPPAERRAHLDRFIAARWPTRGDLRQRFGQALAQRNALVARIAAGHGSSVQLDVWDVTLADAAAALVEARSDAVAELAEPFTATAAELGLEGGAQIEYAPRAAGSSAEIRSGLADRREADLRLGRTSWGPHLDELKIGTGGRSLRRYGSQGQQRSALLALLFAERDALLEARKVAPLLLLDDVMSELDPRRRERLVEGRAPGAGADLRRGRGLAAGGGAGKRRPDAPRRCRGSRGMSRRRAPRPAATALRAALDQSAPKTPLAALQGAWADMVGEQIAAVTSPVSERQGEVTVGCSDSVWAQELDLMQSQLLERLRERLGEQAPRSLRFRVEDARK